MSIRNAGKAIREARLKTGLTQEQLSEGVCSTLSLSRIENGSSGVSPVTFQALMNHAGATCEVYPVFANRTDFDCFYTLKRTQYFLDSWQLQEAYHELEKVEAWNFATNKLYYQEWLYLQGRLQIRSGSKNHPDILNIFLDALAITRPELDFTDISELLLSIVEIELLTAIAQEFLYLGNSDNCYLICSQISTYLANAEIDYLKKDRLYAEYAIVYSNFLLKNGEYKASLALADSNRRKMVQNCEDAPLLELTFLTALGYYYVGDFKNSYAYFKNTFYSAHSIESCYATICRNYVKAHNLYELDEYLATMSDIPTVTFPIKKVTNTSALTDGTYDFLSPDILTIGKLIQELRTEQGVSQTILSQGLCSKSKLSKIEHDLLQPDIFLTEALLQRLGISERVLTFWGNERESKLYELKFKLIHTPYEDISSQEKLLDSFKSLLCKNDIVSQQFYLFNTALLESTPQNCILMLFEALHYTLPDFDITHIHSYRLTWNELTILNNIAHQYRMTDTPYLGSQLLQKLLEYAQNIRLDTSFAQTIYPVSIYVLCRSLYTQKRFHELSALLTPENKHILKFNLRTYLLFLFYYCQGIAECELFDSAKKNAIYTCSINDLFEQHENSVVIINAFRANFSIIL